MASRLRSVRLVHQTRERSLSRDIEQSIIAAARGIVPGGGENGSVLVEIWPEADMTTRTYVRVQFGGGGFVELRVNSRHCPEIYLDRKLTVGIRLDDGSDVLMKAIRCLDSDGWSGDWVADRTADRRMIDACEAIVAALTETIRSFAVAASQHVSCGTSASRTQRRGSRA